jgi:mono/diheme cytochrome c family protein
MCSVRRNFIGSLCACALLALVALCLDAALTAGAQSEQSAANAIKAKLRTQRTSGNDLEVGGELAGVAAGETRYISREDLLALPQVTFTVTHDTNFKGPTKVQGVALEELARDLGAAGADFVVAICSDKYQAHYPHEYIVRHKPVLVLEVDGKPPVEWPKDPAHGVDMGPYTISHPQFVRGPKILSASEEPQIPWGVVRLDFHEEKAVFGVIAPRAPKANDPAVQAGYKIARENCFRCHNVGDQGGQKSGLSWQILAAFATGAPAKFKSYVRDPASQNPKTQMPAQPEYDDETMRALVAYFATFAHPQVAR